jgi:hypothetical protein
MKVSVSESINSGLGTLNTPSKYVIYYLASKEENYSGTSGLTTIYSDLDVLNSETLKVIDSGATLTIDSSNKSNRLLFSDESEKNCAISENGKTINGVETIKSTYPRSFNLNDLAEVDVVDRLAYTRTPNPVPVRCEIRYGRDNSVYNLIAVMIDYIKAP